jgi:hypothetical protein
MVNPVLKYVPILRVRQEEIKVLKSFDFGQRIYPCLEIIKENDRLLPKIEKDNKKAKPAKDRSFEEAYTPLIQGIKAKHVFIDLPLHLRPAKTMKPGTISFLQNVVLIRSQRTAYIKKLRELSPKVIPIISSYGNISGEKSTIVKQEEELRSDFKTIGFRTFMNTFNQDISQIEEVAKETDYLIMDWENTELDLTDGDQEDIVARLIEMNCNVVVHRNCYHNDITNVSLVHV